MRYLLGTAAALALSAPAFSADESMKSTTKVEKDSNGNYDEKDKTVTKDASGKRKNLGTFSTREEAKRHERAVQYFKHKG